MSDIKDTLSEKAGEFKTQASEKLDQLKEQAGTLGEGIKEKAGEVMDKLKSGDVQEELNHLKDEASEKISDLAGKAKGFWNKITGSGDEKA